MRCDYLFRLYLLYYYYWGCYDWINCRVGNSCNRSNHYFCYCLHTVEYDKRRMDGIMASLEFWKNMLSKEAYDQAERKYKEKACIKNTCASSNVERTPINEPLEEKKTARFNGCVRVSFTTVRRVKPRDHRAISEKYALDSLVSCGVLQDDSTKIIPEEPIVKCLAGMPECTIIEIEEV